MEITTKSNFASKIGRQEGGEIAPERPTLRASGVLSAPGAPPGEARGVPECVGDPEPAALGLVILSVSA